MQTRSLPFLAVLALGALSVPAPALPQEAEDDLAHELEHVERSLWHGWATHDQAAFQESIVDAAINVGPWGTIAGKEAIMGMIASHTCELEDAQFSDWAAHRVSDDTTILTYTARQKGTCDGEELPAKVAVSAVYIRHGDHWMSASYHETPLEQ